MKKWFSQLIGSPGGDGSAAPGAGMHETAAAAAAAGQVGSEIDAAWYRLLTASAGYFAAPDVEERMLAEVQALADQPGAAAGLVPRMPGVIPELLRGLEDDASPAALAQQVAQDVVLMAEVIREANSAYYRPMTPVKTAEAAVMMLGQNGLRMLLARIAFRPIIKMSADGFARSAAPRIWNQSEKCALASSLLAPGLSASVFKSCLAGLMQNVGLVVALRIADRVCEDGKVPGSGEFGVRLLAASRQLSCAIARHWDFPREVADAIWQPGAPGGGGLGKALAMGDRIAKLRLLLDEGVLAEDDPLVSTGLDSFQRRCLGKLANIDG